MLNNMQLAGFASKLADNNVPTWPRASCDRCTKSFLGYMKHAYPGHYNDVTTQLLLHHTEQRTICTDSAGILRGFFWSDNGYLLDEYWRGQDGYKLQWKRYGFGEWDATKIKDMCKQLNPSGFGEIKAGMPNVPGLILFRRQTLGIYIGDGMVVSARLHKTVAKTSINTDEWLTWAYLPFRFLRYIDSKDVKTNEVALQIGACSPIIPTIKHKLYDLGFYGHVHPDFSGLFDRDLQTAVLALQARLDLYADGVINNVLLDRIQRLVSNKDNAISQDY